jgi:multiple sugar transport system permease protein
VLGRRARQRAARVDEDGPGAAVDGAAGAALVSLGAPVPAGEAAR